VARIRTIKIGFFRNEDLAVFSHAHQLLFEGLWLLADRHGLLEDRPQKIHAELFPYQRDRSLDVNAMLDELASYVDPFIHRYTVNGRKYIAVLNFGKHQRPHHTEPESDIPGPEHRDDLNPPDKHRESPDGKERKEEDLRKGKEGKGESRLAPAAQPADLMLAWNDGVSEPIPQCQGLSPERTKKARARLRDAALDVWRIVIGRINASPFCRGENDRRWVATFDWLLQPDVRLKVLEGKYDSRARPKPKPLPDVDWFEECKRVHNGECGLDRYRHGQRMDTASL
jgi:hypothetical protein